jgi:hypothetical protein
MTDIDQSTGALTPFLSNLLQVIATRGCSISEAAIELGTSNVAAHNAMYKGINDHGVDELIRRHPGAAPTVLAVHEKKKSKRGNVSRPAVSAAHPAEIDPHADLLPTLKEKLALTISYIDRYNVSNAKLSELNSIIKTLFDMSQVLQGKPTSISSSENTKALSSLVPALMREIQRRGMIDVKGEVIEVVDAKPRKTRSDKGVPKRGAGIEALGSQAHPPGGSGSGPVQPSAQSEFSKLLEDF